MGKKSVTVFCFLVTNIFVAQIKIVGSDFSYSVINSTWTSEAKYSILRPDSSSKENSEQKKVQSDAVSWNQSGIQVEWVF